MYKQRLNEIARCYFIFGGFSPYLLPLYEHHLKLGDVDRSGEFRNLYWDDATKIANYLDYVMKRINKYGLHWGILNPKKFDGYKEQMKKEEDELTQYFLYEMRKPPAEEKEYAEMP